MPKGKPEVGGVEQRPPMNGPSEPQSQEPKMGDDSLDIETSEMENGSEEQNPFDHNFDAGIGDENDPNYIQRLTGKLSQKLRDQIKEKGEDSDLSKYVLNMIVSAAAPSLDDSDKQDVIEKLNDTPKGEETPEMNKPEQPEPDGMPMENRRRFVKVNEQQLKYIKENFGVVSEPKEKTRVDKKISPEVRRGVKTKPYIAPSFK